ncbi:AMP-binding protein [Streptomyces sp. UNOC14_S4]|uniref:AMP-binding protein n=1 Tax=Streptomyces sp. UNOC14_S4 TaxID=2872340 RepID=UPI001E402E2C|nr:AMP-binding protein [Streptomyces sp. UNOC14_S4]MCC3767696.1 AMP-binding protein [Streptomyces sp. UNOC14_S4]
MRVPVRKGQPSGVRGAIPNSEFQGVQDSQDFRDLVDFLAEHSGREFWYYRGREIVRRGFGEVHADVLAACAALRVAGVGPGTHVGILAGNSYEWIVTDLALVRLRAVSVALPVDTHRDTAPEELRAAYDLRLLLMSRAEYTRRAPAQPWVAPLDAPGDATVAPPCPGHPAPGDDVFTLVFSSGSSGTPKCVMMSARGTAASLGEYARQLRLTARDAIFVVLPLTAFPQRLMVYLAVRHGFDIRLADVPRLHQALTAMAPTVVVGPPAFFETVEHRYRALPAADRRRADRLRRLTRLIPLRTARSCVRRRIFADLHALFGGRARLLLTGSAPARVTTLRLMEELGFPLYEFYGMTEAGVISWNLPGRTRHGSAGRPLLPGTVGIAPDGEVLVRHDPPRSTGYYGVAAATDVYRPDGWTATGDLGVLDGPYLTLTGRKKSVIITRAGHKLQPEPLERALAERPEVAHAVLLGGEHAHVVTAVVSLREPPHDAVRTALDRAVADLNRTLPEPGRIARLLCTDEEFTAANGLLTRTLKPDRAAIADHFRQQLSGPAPVRQRPPAAPRRHTPPQGTGDAR